MKKIPFVLGLILVAAACNKTQSKSDADFDSSIFSGNQSKRIAVENNSAITLDLKKQTGNHVLKMSDLVDSVSYLPLETTEKSLIGAVDDIVSCKDRIFILDTYRGKNVYVFDKQGKFVFKLPNGKGPGEILRPYDLAVNEKKRMLYVYDAESERIVSYNWDGQFIKDQKTPIRFKNFEYTNDSSFLILAYLNDNIGLPEEESKSQLFVVDTTFKIMSHGFPYKEIETKNRFFLNSHLRSGANNLAYSPRFGNEIYEFQNDSVFKKKYKLDFGDDALTEDEFFVDTNVFLKNEKKEGYKYFMGDYVENANDAFFKINIGNNMPMLLFYDLKTKRTVSGSTFALDNPNIPFFSTPAASENNAFVTVVESIYIAQLKKDKRRYDKLPLDLKSEFKAITENSNPVIMYYTLKKF
ncbi:6-bladed beta-propeller [Flavobacterium sharifuzzamanii]|uniref:6-bladed beta-propeller n=1 Tax=Flavobacterium sharifuzzamanii TaxID=2211133 RepID=UPI000DAD8797|nr:6-bladed beta-propeller [Flavobacterium sharifuzzamanii]KAF2080128.1 6-bladed beta-propeller [Flavobacterium sharifuzzamanii]